MVEVGVVDASMHTMVEHLAIQKPILANQNAAFRFLVLRPQWFSCNKSTFQPEETRR